VHAINCIPAYSARTLAARFSQGSTATSAYQSIASGDNLAWEAASSAGHIPQGARPTVVARAPVATVPMDAATGAEGAVPMHSLDDDPFRDDWPHW
jgi:hypothetical protein